MQSDPHSSAAKIPVRPGSRTPAPDDLRAQPADGAARFDYLLPAGKQWFTLSEIAKLIERSESFALALYERGVISGHSFCAGTGQRKTKRVPRCFVISMLIKTAEYSEEIKLLAFLSCLREFAPDGLRKIATVAACLAGKKREGNLARDPRRRQST